MPASLLEEAVSVALAQRDVDEAVRLTEERLRSVQLLGDRVRVHANRVQELASRYGLDGRTGP